MRTNFLWEQIFVETNFHKWPLGRENRENFCFTKISRYTAIGLIYLKRWEGPLLVDTMEDMDGGVTKYVELQWIQGRK